MPTFLFQISGLTCPACTKLAKLKIEKIEGVENAHVLEDGQTEIYADRDINIAEVGKALEGTDYIVNERKNNDN